MFTPIRFAVGIGTMLYLSFIAATRSDYLLVLINLLQLLGIIFNAIVVLSNGGKMPVTLKEAQSVWQESTHTAVTNNTKFVLLCDRFELIRLYFSIGDIYIITGICLFLFYLLANYILL